MGAGLTKTENQGKCFFRNHPQVNYLDLFNEHLPCCAVTMSSNNAPVHPHCNPGIVVCLCDPPWRFYLGLKYYSCHPLSLKMQYWLHPSTGEEYVCFQGSVVLHCVGRIDPWNHSEEVCKLNKWWGEKLFKHLGNTATQFRFTISSMSKSPEEHIKLHDIMFCLILIHSVPIHVK